MTNTNKQKTETRSIKHKFTADEVAKLNEDFGLAYDAVKSHEADFDSVRIVHKSKITEAEARMTTLRNTINAGFEMRSEKCVVVYVPADGLKLFYLESTYSPDAAAEGRAVEPVATEPMTDADYQQELIQAESIFEARQEIVLFPAIPGGDRGVLAVGRQGGKWFSALRVKIGSKEVAERLDNEQKCSTKRADQIKRALKQFGEWLDSNFDRETAKGFRNAMELVKAEHAEREE